MKKLNEKQVKQAYIDHVYDKARRIAFKKDGALVPNTQHLAIAILEQVAEAYVANQMLVSKVNELSIDVSNYKNHTAIKSVK